jgi:hypothetical protein
LDIYLAVMVYIGYISVNFIYEWIID